MTSYRLAALFLALALPFLSPGSATGGWDEAHADYERGDYHGAFREFMALAVAGNSSAQVNIGTMYDRGEGVPQNQAEAARWYRRAADQGNARAQNNLGQLYARGEGVPQNHAEAARRYRRAAEHGYADAQYNIVWLYYRGEGVSQNYAEAARWFRPAADQGNAHAQFSLGLMYYLGKGVPQNNTEAARWLRPAAEKGNANAQGLLGAMYYDGTGVPQDDVQAYMWLTLAAAGETDPDLRAMVAEARKTVAARLSPAQRARAEEMARNWRPEAQPVPEVASPPLIEPEPEPPADTGAATSGFDEGFTP